MDTRPPFFVAVALFALAAALAGSAQARMSYGNGTQPPSVVDEQQALPSAAQASIPEGNGTKPPTGAQQRQARQASVTLFVDPVYASLDPAIRTAIVKHTRVATLAAARQARLQTLLDGYNRLNS